MASSDSKESANREYQIVSSYPHGLPVRMNGKFTFAQAHQLCCDWNTWHLPQDMAFPEKIDERVCYLEDL